MTELLAPAGNMAALVAAVANGADAVYLGMTRFGARAYSDNFTAETLPEAVAYAHLRGVKVYATVNTIVYQDELPDAYAELDFLDEAGVDGVIVQDLALLRYAAAHCRRLEPHTSTQMGIDDTEGALLAKELGARRVVLAREDDLATVKAIRAAADVPVEVFVHGALCVSYSGNCIMSGMTGNRLGNRGRCIGSCRKRYTVTDTTAGEVLGTSYILSTRDLCTVEHAAELAGIDSLKIEGRMKEPAYVANTVSVYRKALDGAVTPADIERLNRTFQRTFTPGYLFGTDRRAITNTERPNNHGYACGTVSGFARGMTALRLTSPLHQGDAIRIRHADDDVTLTVAKLFDARGNLISGAAAGETCYLKLRERLRTGDAVFITKEAAFTRELEGMLRGEYRRTPVDFTVHAYVGAPLTVEARAWGISATHVGDEALSAAKTRPTSREDVAAQLDRLGDTVFCLGDVELCTDGAYVPGKLLNAARKALTEELSAARIAHAAAARPENTPGQAAIPATATVACVEAGGDARLTAVCVTQAQADAAEAAGIAPEDIYTPERVIPRNAATYTPREGEVLVGGLGGIRAVRGMTAWVADYSLNTVNAASLRTLLELGARRVTLSYEMNRGHIADTLDAYRAAHGATPPVEVIVYGRAPLLVTKYCPLKPLGQCGTCKTHSYRIAEEYGTFPLLTHENCNTTVLNGKILNLLDELTDLCALGVTALRLNFTTEDPAEVTRVVHLAQDKLAGTASAPAFNRDTDTRGHWNREIL